MNIRRIQLSDRRALIEHFKVVIKATYAENGIHDREDMDKELASKISYMESDYESGGKEKQFYIAELEHKLIGTVTFGHANQMICEITNDELSKMNEIGTLYVHPDYHGQGVGSQLIDHVERVLRERGDKQYCLDCGYPVSQQKWLHKFGVPSYIAKNYWGEGNDHLIWIVAL